MRGSSQQHPSVCSATGVRVAIVVSRFNPDLTERLLSGAQRCLAEAGASAEAVTVVQVPGAFEIPVAARWLANSGRYDSILCLGCVIRGATPHFDHICRECAHGIQQVAVTTGVPCIFGVLMAETREHAEERAGGRCGNLGEQSARTAVEMAQLARQIRHGAS